MNTEIICLIYSFTFVDIKLWWLWGNFCSAVPSSTSRVQYCFSEASECLCLCLCMCREMQEKRMKQSGKTERIKTLTQILPHAK